VNCGRVDRRDRRRCAWRQLDARSLNEELKREIARAAELLGFKRERAVTEPAASEAKPKSSTRH
jgi:hypothetical protein